MLERPHAVWTGRGRGRKSEAETGDGKLQRFGPEDRSQVVRFVHDEKVEPVPDATHVTARALERGDGHGREHMGTVSEDADLALVEPAERLLPLAQHDPGRHQDQRASRRSSQGRDGQARLARSGREHDEAARAGGFPTGEGRGLVGPKLDLAPLAACPTPVSRGRIPTSRRPIRGTHAVFERDRLGAERVNHGRVEPTGTAVPGNAPIPDHAGEMPRVEARGRVLEDYGSAVENEAHGRVLARGAPSEPRSSADGSPLRRRDGPERGDHAGRLPGAP